MNSLWDCALSSAQDSGAVFHGRDRLVPLTQLARESFLGGALEGARDRSILLSTEDQLETALALLELDGSARRVVLCTPDLSPDILSFVAATAECDMVVSDRPATLAAVPELAALAVHKEPTQISGSRRASRETEWILLTSGTTGTPKLVTHSLESLSGALPRGGLDSPRRVWSTFYDIRRYGGLQIYLRAVLGGSSLVLSNPTEPTAEFFARATAAGVTHMSGTPSHWRRALMSGAATGFKPNYVRLSGEIADQTVLDSLKAAFPNAGLGHAFASTEAGVAFDVNDGLAGFPASYLAGERNGVTLKVDAGTLRIRSSRIATRYLGEAAEALQSPDGYVDTGDLVERLGERYFFQGRKSGVINVGGLKVHPEEVEAVLNTDVRVRMSLVRARRNPILGAVVAAEVVLTPELASVEGPAADAVKAELLAACRQALPAHKVPSTLRFVAALELTAAGKLVRPNA